jgi:hypothetical protein
MVALAGTGRTLGNASNLQYVISRAISTEKISQNVIVEYSIYND